MIRFHKLFSYGFVALSVLHLMLYVVYFGMAGTLGENIIFGAIPYEYDATDFTVPAMWYLFLFVICPVFVALTVARVRRLKYELFYYGHIVGAFVVVTAVCWHASSAWYYIIPPVILYAVDQLLLMVKATRICHITDIKTLPGILSRCF